MAEGQSNPEDEGAKFFPELAELTSRVPPPKQLLEGQNLVLVGEGFS